MCLCLPSPVVQMCQAQGIEWSSLAELGLTKALAEFMVAMAILKHSETNLKSSAQLCCQRPLCKCLQPTTAPRCLSLVPFLAPWYRSSGPKVLPACICTQRERDLYNLIIYIYTTSHNSKSLSLSPLNSITVKIVE